jgi:protein TonB
MSSMQIVKPSLPQNREVILPVPPTILDPDAPAVLPRVDDLGLPWMKNRNNSPGPGEGNTIGNSGKGGMGEEDGAGAGFSDKGIYKQGVTSPTCVYCPDPLYSDEARESKVQGSVMLEVLVDTNGRASQIRILKGVGMGLDERAVQSVKTWRFQPARDAAHRPVAAWITIEAIFRLF